MPQMPTVTSSTATTNNTSTTVTAVPAVPAVPAAPSTSVTSDNYCRNVKNTSGARQEDPQRTKTQRSFLKSSKRVRLIFLILIMYFFKGVVNIISVKRLSTTSFTY